VFFFLTDFSYLCYDASMVSRHVSSAYNFAEDVHTSVCVLCELAYLIGTIALFVSSNLCLIVASVIFLFPYDVRE
jgi:hypothetical protein